MNADAPLLRIQGLSVSLPASADRRHAVEDLSLDLWRNEILCVVGESGSGKSVMSRAVLGLFPSRHVQPSAGRILFEGEDLLQATPERLRDLRGNRIAMIFQEPMTALNPVLRIGAQIDEVLEIHRSGDGAARRERVLELLAAVNLPDPQQILSAYPHQLSGGQRQRAMIAMALALEPDILIADEPTTALDVTTQAQILLLIRELQRKKGMGVIFVTHDFGVVAEIADRIAVMQHGHLVEQGPAEQVLNRPQADYTRSLLAAVPSLTPGPKRDFSAQPVVLSVNALSKSYRSGGGLFGGKGRSVDALSAVSFSVRRGETVGIVGESGSGKSTAARCIARLINADSGQILVEGADIAPLSVRALRPVRRRMQMVFQDPFGSLNPRRTVGQLIAEGPIVHGLSEVSAHARALELLDLVGLERRAAARYPHEFSGGQRQRIGLARALALEPAILVADEPVSALDVSVQDQVLRLLADIRNRLGLTVLFITHDLRVASQVCDSIVVMHKGRVVESGPVADVYARPAHAYTQALLAAVPGRHWSHDNEARLATAPSPTP
ncbi:ABC transporter ATP-binding protein [Ideonella sp. A 288]|uniref:ABC transporter ATP-binding protein n=1 Tax=Ideonella sp. A 288 TaxID=1962181 RepID=UPI000B4B9CB4|nr:ABC transporter ATP-binding protein [Ideonella sp. A 288]